MSAVDGISFCNKPPCGARKPGKWKMIWNGAKWPEVCGAGWAPDQPTPRQPMTPGQVDHPFTWRTITWSILVVQMNIWSGHDCTCLAHTEKMRQLYQTLDIHQKVETKLPTHRWYRSRWEPDWVVSYGWGADHDDVTGPLCGEFTGHRWIPFTKASDTELWCFLRSASEQWVE